MVDNHFLCGLKDALIILTVPKASIKSIREFTFITGSSRSAYNMEIIEKSVLYFIKALSYMPAMF